MCYMFCGDGTTVIDLKSISKTSGRTTVTDWSSTTSEGDSLVVETNVIRPIQFQHTTWTGDDPSRVVIQQRVEDMPQTQVVSEAVHSGVSH